MTKTLYALIGIFVLSLGGLLGSIGQRALDRDTARFTARLDTTTIIAAASLEHCGATIGVVVITRDGVFHDVTGQLTDQLGAIVNKLSPGARVSLNDATECAPKTIL